MKLANCPFCGEDRAECLSTSGGNFRISCQACGGAGGICGTKAGAINAWDSREEARPLRDAILKIVKYADSEPDGGTFVEMHRANIERGRDALAKVGVKL